MMTRRLLGGLLRCAACRGSQALANSSSTEREFMNHQNMRDRRSFLRLSAGAIGVGMLPACSGQDAAETDAASSTGSTGSR